MVPISDNEVLFTFITNIFKSYNQYHACWWSVNVKVIRLSDGVVLLGALEYFAHHMVRANVES